MHRYPLRSVHLLLVALLALALGLAACGGDDEGSGGGSSTTSTAAEETPAAKTIKVGMVTDIGGLNDRSFNQSANDGLKRAKAEKGIETRVLTSASDRDYVPNLSTLARQNYDLVIAVGFLMAEATEKVAKSFPDTQFTIIDYPQVAMKSKPANVHGLLFAEQQAGYLVGYMAGLYAKDEGGKAISTVGGQKIPPVDHYIAGFQAGAKAANPGIKTLNAYSQDFVDAAKCKEIALNQIGEGSIVVFQVAGQCGLGALDAAKEKKLQGIGVDADQGYLGNYMMTSALKKIDEAVFATIGEVQDGTFKGGTDQVFDLKNDGVGYGKTNDVGSKYTGKVDEVKAKIVSGEITDIPDTVAGK
jgi:basic membrane protein A